MKTNASTLALILSVSLAGFTPTAHASTSFAGTRMITQPSANHTKSTKGVLTLDQAAQNVSFADKMQSVNIPYGQITSMRLEQTVDRIRTPFTGRVEHQEFLTLTYGDSTGHQDYAVFQLNSRSYREVVAALEAQTSKRVDWTAN
jgi:hypothetical protein